MACGTIDVADTTLTESASDGDGVGWLEVPVHPLTASTTAQLATVPRKSAARLERVMWLRPGVRESMRSTHC
ncbi:hypothetical protein GCM10009861_13510 [Neomicrococcus aestuarii]